jgi:hypothetical protein
MYATTRAGAILVDIARDKDKLLAHGAVDGEAVRGYVPLG